MRQVSMHEKLRHFLFRIVSQLVSIKFLKKIWFGLNISAGRCSWSSAFLYSFRQITHIMKPVSMNEGSLKRPINKRFKIKNRTKTIGLKNWNKKRIGHSRYHPVPYFVRLSPFSFHFPEMSRY